MDQPVSIEKIRAATGGAPDAVTAMAEVLPIGKVIKDRLITDKRMDSVWPELRKWPVDPNIVEKVDLEVGGIRLPDQYELRLAPQVRLRTYGISIANRSPQDQAIAAVFAFCVIEFSQVRLSGTVKDAQRLAQPYFDAAATYRSLMSEAPHPPPEIKHAIEVATAYAEHWAQSMSQRAQNGPYFAGVYDSKLGTELRARFRVLTAATHTIYKMRMPHTVATMLSVALDIPPINKATADDWSKDPLPSSWVLEPPG
jgi:hypothetical protein